VGFGGDGFFVAIAPENDRLGFNTLGHTGGGCVQDGPFTEPHFHVNVGTPGCLKRDFSAFIMNWLGNSDNVNAVLRQPDYRSFAFELEGFPNFTRPNIHASGHFGVGGGQGTIGDRFNSPGGNELTLSIHDPVP
jgi:tyrosinase